MPRSQPWDGTATEGIWTIAANAPSPWWVFAEVVERQGRLVIKRLYITAGESLPQEGLTARDLRRFPIGSAVRDTRWKWRLRLFDEVIPPPPPPERQQGRAREDEFYADVAVRYLAAFRKDRYRTNVVLRNDYLRRGWSPKKATLQQVASWVRLARRYGWLTPSRRGVSGGEATEKLLAWQKKKSAERRRAARKKKEGKR